jgi:hypothetical protein
VKGALLRRLFAQVILHSIVRDPEVRMSGHDLGRSCSAHGSKDLRRGSHTKVTSFKC